MALILLLATAGVVAGGTLFAGEAEAGTLNYLHWLSPSRFQVWWRKVLIGVGLALACAGGIFGVAVAMGMITPVQRLSAWGLVALAVTLASFGWGVLGSVVVRSSLAACGAGLGMGLVFGVLLYPVVAVVLSIVRRRFDFDEGAFQSPRAWETAFLTTCYALCALPIPIAGWIYTAPDRSRRLASIGLRLPGVRGRVGRFPAGRGIGIRRLIWLARRQFGFTALVLGAAALLAGCVLIPEGVMPLAMWPAFSLVLGVVCGVVGLSDEQIGGSYRFWGERRMPASRLWWAKLAAGLALVLVVTLLLLAPSIVASIVRGTSGPRIAAAFRSGILAEEGFPVFSYLLVWPLCGFVCGHLAALIFRKAIVAGAVGLLTGGVLAAVWLPSILAGGLRMGHVLIPPLLVLLTARVLVWSWVTDRVGTRRPLVRLIAGLAAVLVAVGVGITLRVSDVPVIPQIEDDVRFARELPTFDDKQSGRDLRRAVASFTALGLELRSERPDVPLLVGQRADLQVNRNFRERSAPYLDRVRGVLELGWPADRPDLDAWADRVFQSGWDQSIFDAARKPTGVLEDPNEMSWDTRLRNVETLREFGPLFLARGLQLQARGNPEPFAESFIAWLAAVRTTRNNTLSIVWLIGRGMETFAYEGLDRWLERLAGRPDLLRRVLTAVREHDAGWSVDPNRLRLAHQTVARNGVNAPSQWLPKYLEMIRPNNRVQVVYSNQSPDPLLEAEADLVGFAWTVPWEKERLRRAVGLGNVPGGETAMQELMHGAPGASVLVSPYVVRMQQLGDAERPLIAARRAAILKLALRLYEAENGKPAVSLAEMVPAYLPAVPADPYDDKPFRYRLSRGETIDWHARPVEQIRATPPPGLAPEVPVDVVHAVAGLVGGGVCWGFVPGWLTPPLPPPPGLQPATLDFDQITAVAGVAGSEVFWPDFEFWKPEYSGFVGGGSPLLGSGREPWPPWPWGWSYPDLEPRTKLSLSPGRGILWSVGPDRYDDQGSVSLDPQNVGERVPGDLIYLVPEPKK
jgi:hypothetical protein